MRLKLKLSAEQLRKKLNLKDGKTPTDSELSALIAPLIPDAIPGGNGHTPTKEEIKALIPPPIHGSPDTGTEIVDKINKEKDTLIKKEKIEGLVDIETMSRRAQANMSVFHNSGNFVYDYDLSDSLNGVLKTFALPANARVITVIGSSTPIIFRRTIDFTTTASTITFTSEIDAATTLSAGQTLVVLYKIL